jgi:hypothetical protein
MSKMMSVHYRDSASYTFLRSIYEMGTVSPINISRPTIDVYSELASLITGSSATAEGLEYLATLYRCINIGSIVFRDRQLDLARPIPALVSVQDDRYVIENNELGIFTVNQNFEEGLREFKEDISFILSEYGDERDEVLTSDARELKRKILTYARI